MIEKHAFDYENMNQKGMKTLMRNNVARTTISILLSALIIIGLIFTTDSNLFLTNTLALWIVAEVYFALFLRFVLFGWVSRQIAKRKINIIKVGGLSLLFSFILLCLLPWKYGHVLTNNYIEKARLFNNEITIHVEDQHNSASSAQEVWIDAVKEQNKDYNLYEISLDDQNWIFKDGCIYTDGSTNIDLTICFPQRLLYEIRFKMTPASGMVTISSGSNRYTMDLYSPTKKYAYINWENLYGRITAADPILRLAYYFFYFLIIWIMVFSLTIYLSVRRQRTPVFSRTKANSHDMEKYND